MFTKVPPTQTQKHQYLYKFFVGGYKGLAKPVQVGVACLFEAALEYHSKRGGRGLSLAVLSVCLSPSKAISQIGRQGSQLLHCLALHQLTKALPFLI